MRHRQQRRAAPALAPRAAPSGRPWRPRPPPRRGPARAASLLGGLLHGLVNLPFQLPLTLLRGSDLRTHLVNLPQDLLRQLLPLRPRRSPQALVRPVLRAGRARTGLPRTGGRQRLHGGLGRVHADRHRAVRLRQPHGELAAGVADVGERGPVEPRRDVALAHPSALAGAGVEELHPVGLGVGQGAEVDADHARGPGLLPVHAHPRKVTRRKLQAPLLGKLFSAGGAEPLVVWVAKVRNWRVMAALVEAAVAPVAERQVIVVRGMVLAADAAARVQGLREEVLGRELRRGQGRLRPERCHCRLWGLPGLPEPAAAALRAGRARKVLGGLQIWRGPELCVLGEPARRARAGLCTLAA
mmetsp:Transcript_4002/g.11902  ORF Transcript_4002/g.11902 Transcript_4002/m.11902 type:complete len:356 (-) Transcript_4002:43-1110(-)